MKISHELFCQHFLKIKTKDNTLVPFVMNTPQKRLDSLVNKLEEEKKPVRIIILKARQMGFSTWTESKLFAKAVLNFNTNVGIITHKEDATTNLFNMSKTFYNNLPEEINKPALKGSNAKELIFDTQDGKGLGSKIKCMTAGADGVGRSDTYHGLHVSEYAFWKGNKRETLQGLLNSVPNTANSMVIIESTANGFEDFKELWDKAKRQEIDFIPIFFAWHEMEEYRMPYTGFQLTEKEKDLQKKYNLDLEQLAWRRWTIANKCFNDEEFFNQENPSCEQDAFVSTGRTVFNKEAVINRIHNAPKPLKQGYFEYDYDGLINVTNIKWVDNPKGFIKIYKEPRDYCPYVIAGDTAGEGSDKFASQVIDNTNGEQVAVLHLATDEDLYALQMYCLGHYYNYALIGIESNFSTYPIKMLSRIGYEKQFVRETEDNYTGKTQRSYGFKTTVKTRPIIIANLIKIFRENPEIFNDEATLEEFLTFVRNPDTGKEEAMDGKHDDLVMSCAIAFYMYLGDQQSHVINEKHVSLINKKAHFWADELTENNEEGEYVSW